MHGAVLTHHFPSPRSACGRQEISTNHIHISGYSTVSTVYKHGKGVESKLVPSGYPDSKTGSPGVGLRLMENNFFSRAAKATAARTASVLDRDSILVCCRCAQPQHYRPCGSISVRIDVPETKAAAEET